MGNHKYHTYKRVNLARPAYKRGQRPEKKTYLVLKCTEMGCNHYVPLHLAEGKIAKCPICEQFFELDKKALKLAVPHCVSCTKSKDTDELSSTMKFIEDLANDNR